MRKLVFVLILTIVFVVSGRTINFSSGRNFNHYAKKQTNISSLIKPGDCVYTNLTHMDITVTGQDTSECIVLADLSVSATSREITDAVIGQIEIELTQQAAGI